MNKKLIRITESDLHKIVKESVNRVLREGINYGNEYEVGFTFFISLGENKMEHNQSIITKDELLDLLDIIHEIDDYDVENDGEDWCVNCIAHITAETIKDVDEKMNQLLANVDITWDYHYIKGINTNEYWQP
jgi:hypothetical protein